ncbi:MAG: Digeranylgeranylglycerophospholipid reductase [Candidatus Heimdallarchaeota archaeon LC_3]|nr:MAG: Digeranylgeranylglycerophospholipid reductase [Candidatus Heimdallarchaeota archaeon LC_3]
MQNYDVLIVGAGPAGTICSYYLAKNGLEVALIDKGQLTLEKTCGGGISNYSLNELPFSLPDFIIEQKIFGISFIAPNHNVFIKKELNSFGVTVRRNKFDSFLIEKAIDKGVTYYPCTKISKIVQFDNSYYLQDKFKGTYLIGADGANSTVARIYNIGKKPVGCLGIRAIIQLPQEKSESFLLAEDILELYFQRHLYGYGWVFPLRNSINLGVGVVGNTKNIKKIMLNFAEKCFDLRKLSFKNISMQSHPIPFLEVPKYLFKDRVLLIGDAAGLVDPVSGEGIHYAIRSGKIAAEALIRDFDMYGKFSSNHLGNYYANNLKKDVLPNIRVAQSIRKFMEMFVIHHMDFWFYLMKRNPFLLNFVPELATSNDYYKVYIKTLRNLPLILIKTLKKTNGMQGYTFYEKHPRNWN